MTRKDQRARQAQDAAQLEAERQRQTAYIRRTEGRTDESERMFRAARSHKHDG